jgi:hypothetical protein
MVFLLIPFSLQAIAMVFDEFYFHYRRPLHLWERLGHPLDTFTVFVCYLFLNTQAYSEVSLNIFIILAAISCLFITKDEWVHKELCSAGENWLHAVLFVLHPLCFVAAGFIWKEQLSHNFILIQTAAIFVFMIYQIIYWSLPWKKRLHQ